MQRQELVISLTPRERVSKHIFQNALLLLNIDVVRLDLPVSLGTSLLGTLWSSLTAQTRCSVGSSDPDRLKPFRRLLKGELHSLALLQATEALHVQFALLMKDDEFTGLAAKG